MRNVCVWTVLEKSLEKVAKVFVVAYRHVRFPKHRQHETDSKEIGPALCALSEEH